MLKQLTFFFAGVLLLACCQSPSTSEPQEFKVEFEKFELNNGLDVIFHIDRSDPVVAVALTAHVGSAREKEGRTGFAHLFEHLLFLESENLGKGGLDKMSARIGGSGANGSTSRDRTNYFQTVPNDALEKMIWAEADKLGWFINTVTEPVLAKEKQVVKNEKRQSDDNRPYGHNQYVIDKALYPTDHPYNWQVIGSLEDLQNATLDDVKEFFRKWYVPNNVTLVISGDFDVDQAKAWVKKYFDEIPAVGDIQPLEKRSGVVNETTLLYHEDNFARLPQLTMAWPSVELYHPDGYPLAVLTEYLTVGKKAPFNKVLVDSKQITSDVSMFNYDSELAGQTHLVVRAYEGIDLDTVKKAINEAFSLFEKEGISQEDLNRIKAGQESNFYNGLSSVLGKGFQLAQYNIFADDPGFVNKDIQNILAVTPADVKRVYETYIKGKNYVASSFVPKGNVDLALTGSTKAEVVEEPIVIGAEEEFDPNLQAEYEPTPSTFDRSTEPAYGQAPTVAVPAVWETSLDNGLMVYGIESKEVPLVQFDIVIDGGQLMESIDKVGVSNMLAEMMTKGTKNKTTEELEDAIAQLGATIRVSANKEEMNISANTLSKNYDQTLALVQEILLEPRWDASELELVKQRITSQLKQEEANPNSIASSTFDQLIYGQKNVLSRNQLGSLESVADITMEDLIAYYLTNIAPNISRMHLVGALTEDNVVKSLKSLDSNWEKKEVEVPSFDAAAAPDKSTVYFYDVPGAKQSVLQIGYPALAESDPDYYAAVVMNYILGGGGFASQLTQELRETKGYTYGIGSSFSGTTNTGPFTISSGVRSNVSLESTLAIKDILINYGKNYTEQDLETTKGFLIKSNARAFETASAKLNMLQNVSKYDWQYDYVKQREKIVNEMTVERIQELASKYLDTNKMYWLVVGDAETQLDRMKDLGFGDPILINDTKGPEN